MFVVSRGAAATTGTGECADLGPGSVMVQRIATGGAPPECAPRLHLMAGGPGLGLLRRLRGETLRWHPRRVALVLAALTWLPLIVSGLLGSPLPGSLLCDLATHVRLLVALPVLVLVERPLGASLASAVAQFVASGLVRSEQHGRYVALIADCERLRDSRVAEIVVLGLVCAVTLGLFSAHRVREAGAWMTTAAGRTPAGLWYGLVALPIFHLIWLRWLYLLGVWALFLARVARLDLRLNPAHPDGAGGLGFLGESSIALGALLFAASAVFAGEGLRRVLFAGAGVASHWPGAVMLLAVALALFVGPLLAFMPALIRVKHRGVLEYGALASCYVQQFADRWIAGQGEREALLGTPDVQSLSDLASTHDRVLKMSVVPLGRREAVAIMIPGLIPLLVLAAASVPMREVLGSLLRIFA